MIRDDEDFSKKIVTYLDAAAGNVRPGIGYRLQLARQEALARLADPARATELRVAHAGNGAAMRTVSSGHGFWASGRVWLGIALLVAAVFGVQQWQAYQQLREIEETDAALLSSDLPIDAYLDRGFQNWLHTAADEH
jgi:hypothetical protein